MKSRPAFEHTRSCLSCQSASCFYPHDAKKPGWDQHMPVWGPHQHNIQHWGNWGCPWVSACPPPQHPQGAQAHPGTGQTNLPGKQADGWEARGALPAQLVPPPGSCSAFFQFQHFPSFPQWFPMSQCTPNPQPLPPAGVGAVGPAAHSPAPPEWGLPADVWGEHAVAHLRSFG